MNVSQIYGIVNEVAKQIMGTDAIKVVDTASLVALGKSLDSMDKGKERFFKVINDMIAKTVIDNRVYQLAETGIFKDTFTYGAIIRKIHIDMPEAKVNNAWNIGESNYTPEYAPVAKVNVRMKLFEGITTMEFDYTIPDNLFNSAFNGEAGIAALINGIGIAVETSLNMKIESCIELTRASFVARKAEAGNKRTYVNLLKMYNDEFNQSLTPDAALHTPAFIKFANSVLWKYPKRLAKMTKAYNEEGYERFTDASKLNVDVLTDYATASMFYLESDTYHRELIQLPKYREVPYWQGIGKEDTFENNSKIYVNLDSDEDDIVLNNVIAIMYDDEAIAVTMNDRRTTSERNNKDEYTNFYSKANIGYLNDLSQNAVVFYLSERDYITDAFLAKFDGSFAIPSAATTFGGVAVSALIDDGDVTFKDSYYVPFKVEGELQKLTGSEQGSTLGAGHFLPLMADWDTDYTVTKVEMGITGTTLTEVNQAGGWGTAIKVTDPLTQTVTVRFTLADGKVIDLIGDLSAVTLEA